MIILLYCCKLLLSKPASLDNRYRDNLQHYVYEESGFLLNSCYETQFMKNMNFLSEKFQTLQDDTVLSFLNKCDYPTSMSVISWSYTF